MDKLVIVTNIQHFSLLKPVEIIVLLILFIIENTIIDKLQEM